MNFLLNYSHKNWDLNVKSTLSCLSVTYLVFVVRVCLLLVNNFSKKDVTDLYFTIIAWSYDKTNVAEHVVWIWEDIVVISNHPIARMCLIF